MGYTTNPQLVSFPDFWTTNSMNTISILKRFPNLQSSETWLTGMSAAGEENRFQQWQLLTTRYTNHKIIVGQERSWNNDFLMIWCSCSSHARKIQDPTDHWRQETVHNSTKRTFQQKNKPTTPTSPIAFMTFLVNMKHVEIHGVLPTNLNLQKKTEDGLGLLVIWVLALGLDFVVEEREARHPLWWHPPDRGWEPSTCYDHRYPQL